MPKHSNENKAIGVFDSGLGGLTVVKELMQQLPNERIVYYGDTARVPYGTKSPKTILRFSVENTLVLLKHNVKIIIIACNTSSSYALATLKKNFKVPIVGVVDPGARRAVTLTKNKRVGVIATAATINSQSYQKALRRYDNKLKIVDQKCTLFVPLVEEGWFDHKITEEVARQYLKELKNFKIDTLILGCTHYPLLKSTLKKVMGKDVVLVDSAKQVVEDVKAALIVAQNLRKAKQKPKHMFLISDRPQEFKKLAKRFLGRDIPKIARVADV